MFLEIPTEIGITLWEIGLCIVLPAPLQMRGYHGILDDRVAPALVVVRHVGRLAVRAVEASLDVVTIVTKHAQDDVVLQSILQSGREVCGVYPGEIVDIGAKPQQQVHQLIVAMTKGHLEAI